LAIFIIDDLLKGHVLFVFDGESTFRYHNGYVLSLAIGLPRVNEKLSETPGDYKTRKKRQRHLGDMAQGKRYGVY
jgi:hypothetical protein